MNSYYSETKRSANSFKEVSDEIKMDEHKEHEFDFRDDRYGDYHVEQDDETEDDALVDKGPR